MLSIQIVTHEKFIKIGQITDTTIDLKKKQLLILVVVKLLIVLIQYIFYNKIKLLILILFYNLTQIGDVYNIIIIIYSVMNINKYNL